MIWSFRSKEEGMEDEGLKKKEREKDKDLKLLKLQETGDGKINLKWIRSVEIDLFSSISEANWGKWKMNNFQKVLSPLRDL